MNASLNQIEVPDALLGYRRVAVDGGLLLFDRRTGWNALVESEETHELRLVAPRFVQFAITNQCNLACTFCSRDVAAESQWTAEDAFALLRDLSAAGTLEVAFGGGEPFAFPAFVDLVRRLHDETELAVNATTNGLLLTDGTLRQLRGVLGQLRLSLYDDNDWRRTVRMLAEHGLRYGVNVLVTPERLPGLRQLVLELATRGCSDVLLLSYNGRDPRMHLSREELRVLVAEVEKMRTQLRGLVSLKLDVCWGERLDAVPQVLKGSDCGAGRDFVVVTSDRCLAPCSFHELRIPISNAVDLLRAWRSQREELASAASDPGCARLPRLGLS